MSKKPSLSSALSQASGRIPPGKAKSVTKSTSANGTAAQPGREGKKAIAGFFDPAVSRQLKEIGLKRGDLSVQDMLAEAINDFFTKHGRSAIA